jgi:uncharacterized protein YlxW (UPF0749 family)
VREFPKADGLLEKSACRHHVRFMWSYSKNPVLQGVTDQKRVERSREDVLARAAALKLRRDRDASQAMKDHETSRVETLAKTARLRAARLARAADEVPSKKATPPKI